MKITDFQVGDCIFSRSEPNIKFTVMSLTIKTDFGLHIYNSSYPFMKEDWELVETTYTTQEAFKMMSDGKIMTSCCGYNYIQIPPIFTFISFSLVWSILRFVFWMRERYMLKKYGHLKVKPRYVDS